MTRRSPAGRRRSRAAGRGRLRPRVGQLRRRGQREAGQRGHERRGVARQGQPDRVGPGDPRRSRRRNVRAEPGVREEVPEHPHQAGGAVLHDLKTTLRLASRQPPARRRRVQQGHPTWAIRQGRAAAPRSRLREDYDWNTATPRRCGSTRPPRRHALRPGTLYGLPRSASSSASSTTRSLSRTASRRRRPGRSSTAARPPQGAGRTAHQFGNLDKYPAIHMLGVSRTARAAPTRDPVLGRGTAFDDPENTKAARPYGLGERGLLPAERQRRRLRPDVAKTSPPARARSSSPAPGCRPTWRRRWATTSASCSRRRERRATPPVATGGTGLPFSITAEPAPRRGRRVHRLHHRPARHDGPEPTPATCPVADTAAAAGRRRPEKARVHGLRHRGSGRRTACPYLDYATPTMYDTLGAVSRT